MGRCCSCFVAFLALAVFSASPSSSQETTEGGGVYASPPPSNQGAAGIVLQFSPLPEGRAFRTTSGWIGLPAYLVTACNTTEERKDFSAAIIRNAAISRGISPASHVYVESVLSRQKKLGPAEVLASVGEVGGLVLAFLASTEVILEDAHPAVKGAPLFLAVGIRVGGLLIKRHGSPVELPRDVLPVWVNIPAGRGQCREFTMFAVPET